MDFIKYHHGWRTATTVIIQELSKEVNELVAKVSKQQDDKKSVEMLLQTIQKILQQVLAQQQHDKDAQEIMLQTIQESLQQNKQQQQDFFKTFFEKQEIHNNEMAQQQKEWQQIQESNHKKFQDEWQKQWAVEQDQWWNDAMCKQQHMQEQMQQMQQMQEWRRSRDRVSHKRRANEDKRTDEAAPLAEASVQFPILPSLPQLPLALSPVLPEDE